MKPVHLATSQAEYQADVVVISQTATGQSLMVFQSVLVSDQALLVGRDANQCLQAILDVGEGLAHVHLDGVLASCLLCWNRVMSYFATKTHTQLRTCSRKPCIHTSVLTMIVILVGNNLNMASESVRLAMSLAVQKRVV